MITPSTIYWVAQCDRIVGACELACMLALIAAITTTAALFPMSVEKNVSGCMKKLVAALAAATWALTALTAAGAVFVPSTKTMAAMYVVPAVANNEKVQDAGNRLYDLAVEWMEELRPKKGGAK